MSFFQNAFLVNRMFGRGCSEFVKGIESRNESEDCKIQSGKIGTEMSLLHSEAPYSIQSAGDFQNPNAIFLILNNDFSFGDQGVIC